MSGEVGGGWPGPGHRGFTGRGRGGPGWKQVKRRPAQGHGLGLGPGMEVRIPQRQAWRRPVGAQTDGPGGILVFGPGDPRTPNTPSQAPHPRWPSRGGGMDGAGQLG